MIDWHSHILPGLDDGATCVDESLAIGRLLTEAGFSVVHCTPHRLRGMYEIPAAEVRAACISLQEVFDQEGVALQLRPGMEYCLDEFFPEEFRDPLPLGDSRRILVETPSRADLQMLKENLFLIRRAGYTPLFAHPERHAFLAPPPSEGVLQALAGRFLGGETKTEFPEDAPLAALREMGAEFQCNLGSIGGYYGSLVKRQVERFLGYGLYSAVGSDAHSSEALARYLAIAVESICRRPGDLCRGLSGDCLKQ